MTIAEEIESKIETMRDEAQAAHLMHFFKCGRGEYGEGDRFLGLRVPQTRSVVKQYRNHVKLDNCVELVASPWHEVRLAGFLLMVELYKQGKRISEDESRKVVDCYLRKLHHANNWDLVDLTAAYILGDWLADHPDQRIILDRLAEKEGKLWHQRVGIVATWMLIRNGEFGDTFRIAEKYLTHSHDLIHKASGWMLREVGKRGGDRELRAFLDRQAAAMPRTMLRYAIEKFPEEERQYYLHKRHTYR